MASNVQGIKFTPGHTDCLDGLTISDPDMIDGPITIVGQADLAELRRKAAAWDALQPVAQAALESWANSHDERSQYEARAALRKLLDYHE